MDQSNDRAKLLAALREEDRSTLEFMIDRLDRDFLSPQIRSPEYVAKREEMLKIAREVLLEKPLVPRRKSKAQKPGSRKTLKPEVPWISPEDKEDLRGRAPPVSEPRDETPGVIKVSTHRRTDKR